MACIYCINVISSLGEPLVYKQVFAQHVEMEGVVIMMNLQDAGGYTKRPHSMRVKRIFVVYSYRKRKCDVQYKAKI